MTPLISKHDTPPHSFTECFAVTNLLAYLSCSNVVIFVPIRLGKGPPASFEQQQQPRPPPPQQQQQQDLEPFAPPVESDPDYAAPSKLRGRSKTNKYGDEGFE
jgi:hypothetical protein